MGGKKASQPKSHYTIRKGTSSASLKGVGKKKKQTTGKWAIAQVVEMFNHAHSKTVFELWFWYYPQFFSIIIVLDFIEVPYALLLE